MPVYFMPDKLENCNYYITRKLKNGTLIRDQLPSEGIYTEYEMSNNSFVKIIRKQQEKPLAARAKTNKPKRIITKKEWL